MAGTNLLIASFLFWGAFFLEHLSKWFIRTEEGYPPFQVWIGQLFHFIMVVGLVMMLKWKRAGMIVTIIGTAAFFIGIGYGGFPFIALLNAIPIVFFIIAR